ncbi:MAG: hypothetical protein HC836_45270 [Richelia sp. RM2_1_2]|nr:hypothetical protein [Richelia sp. RM2_1_2]
MKLRFFKLAEKLASKSNHPVHKHGAVLVYKNQILGIGFNDCKTSPRSPHPWKTKHAEFSAVLSAGLENLSGYDIYIVRKRKNGELANSKPCQSCETMLKSLNVRKVYYSDDNGFKMEKY